MKSLLGLDLGATIVLESVLRLAFSRNDFELKNWALKPQTGRSRIHTTLDDGLWEKLKNKFILFRPLSGDFILKSTGVRFKLDGRKDYLEIATPCSPQVRREILDKIRAMNTERISDPDLRRVAEGHPQFKLAAKKIDLRITDLKQTDVSSRELVEDEWRDREQIDATMHTARTLNPSRFSIIYRVYVPTLRTWYSKEYKDKESIPEQVSLKREGKRVSIYTQGNIWATLHLEPTPPVTVLDGAVPLILEKLGRSDLIERTGYLVLGIANLAFCIPLFWLGYWPLKHIHALYSGNPGLETAFSGLVVMVLLAIVIPVVGPKNFKKAADETFRWLRGRKPKSQGASDKQADGADKDQE